MYDIFFGEADCPRVFTETEVCQFAILNCICLSDFDSLPDITRSFWTSAAVLLFTPQLTRFHLVLYISVTLVENTNQRFGFWNNE